MIREIVGDVITEGQKSKGIIAHQVNVFGVMGAGVAASIKQKLLMPEHLDNYERVCAKAVATPAGVESLIGQVSFIKCSDGTMVANMFSQNARYTNSFVLTNYEAMQSCLITVRDKAFEMKCSVFLPGYVGCGIAGGDWSKVKKIIESVFADTSVEAVIVYWEKGGVSNEN